VEICLNMRKYPGNNTSIFNLYQDKRVCWRDVIRLYRIYWAWKVMKNEVMSIMIQIPLWIQLIPCKKLIQKKKLENKNIKMILMVVLFIILINLKKHSKDQEIQILTTSLLAMIKMTHIKIDLQIWFKKSEKTCKIEDLGELKNGNVL